MAWCAESNDGTRKGNMSVPEGDMSVRKRTEGAQDWSGFVPSEPRVRVRDGQQRRVRVAGLRNIKVRPLGVTKRHIWVCECEIAQVQKRR